MMIYAFAYIILNIYVTLNVRTIYSIMTWKDYQSIVWAALTIFLFLLSFYLLVWIGKNKRGLKDDEDGEVE